MFARVSIKEENKNCSNQSKKTVQRFVNPISQVEEQVNPLKIIQRVRKAPTSLTHSDEMVLQKTIGNRAVCKLLSEINSSPIQKKENKTSLPNNLKLGVENLSGLSMDNVKVHYNSSKPAQVGALAYTQGTDIHVAPGQERNLPHEAWHVVQQAQGRVKPSMQMKGINVNDDVGLEKEADVIGNKLINKDNSVQFAGLMNTNKKDVTYINSVDYLVQMKIGPDAKVGTTVKRDSDQQQGEIIRVIKPSKKSDSFFYMVKIGNTEERVRDSNKNYSVLNLEDEAAKNLIKFDKVNLIDHASTGAGHQAAMLTLINNLDTFKYKGEVHLTYFRWKTTWWTENLKIKSTTADDDYEKHQNQWNVKYKNLNIICHPLGENLDDYKKLFDNYSKAVIDPANATEKSFWEKVWWDEAKGCDKAQVNGPDKYSNKKFITGNKEFGELKEKISGLKKSWRECEMSGTYGHALINAPIINIPKDPRDAKTLTMYAAFDSKSLDKGLADMIKKMTGEDEPWTIILQPFLWANNKHANPQVLKGETKRTDIGDFISNKKKVPVYSKKVDDTKDIDTFVETRSSSQPNKELVKSILKKAKSHDINLISAYYTQDSATDVLFHKLFDALVAAMRKTGINKPTVIALLGAGNANTVNEKAFTDYLMHIPGDVIKGTGSVADLAAIKDKIILEHIGRTLAMPLFERYSLMFVTEGANTWQETLSVGTPSLSVNPTGDTQPWLTDIGFKASAKSTDPAIMMKEASESLVALAKMESKDMESSPEMKKLVDFIKAVRDDKNSDLNLYFKKWSQALSSTEGNQFIAALSQLNV